MSQTDETPNWIIEGIGTLQSETGEEIPTLHEFVQAIIDGRVSPPDEHVEHHLAQQSERYTELEGMTEGMIVEMVLDVVPSWGQKTIFRVGTLAVVGGVIP